MNQNQILIRDHIVQHCIETSAPPTLMYGKLPGTRYSRQYYLANLLYDRPLLERVGVEFVRLVQQNIGHFNFQITGREWSAIPLLASLPIMVKAYAGADISSFMIKRERKNYGKHNFVEGLVDRSKPVMIVDDLANSTDSFRHCVQVCKVEQQLTLLPFIFAVLNKYKRSKLGNSIEYDRYANIKILSVLEGDQIDERYTTTGSN